MHMLRTPYFKKYNIGNQKDNKRKRACLPCELELHPINQMGKKKLSWAHSTILKQLTKDLATIFSNIFLVLTAAKKIWIRRFCS